MRVAYLVSQYPAPSHTFIRREIDALRAQGADISICSIRRPAKVEILSEVDAASERETFYIFPPSPLKALRAAVSMFRANPRGTLGALRTSLVVRNKGLRHFVYAFIYFAEGLIIADVMQQAKVGHLHCHFSNAASQAAMAAAEIAGISFSLTLHGLGDFDYPGGTLLNAKLARAKFIACATQYGRAQAMRLSERAHWDKLLVVRCGLDLTSLPEPATRDPEARFRFICVGRLSPEKGQLGLLTAFAEARRRGLDAELLLVGDGPDRADVDAEVEALGLSDAVVLAGRLAESDTLKEVAAANALVLSSFMEGLPVALMEALGLGVPVIAPTIAGIPELVVDGVTGRLFIAGDWSDLADKILEVRADPEAARRMAEAGRRRILEEFDVAKAVEPLAERFGRVPSVADQSGRRAS